MRVIAGYLGGRIFDSPGTERTHPMSDKIKGALFNALGDIEGLTVLDAFAGSGALSIEAISRGAKHATAIDIDKQAFKTMGNNVAQLGLEDKITVTRAQAGSWSSRYPKSEFDIAIFDPPFTDIRPDILKKLANHAKVGGVVVYSIPPVFVPKIPSSYHLLSTKQYGDATLVFYRRIS